MSMMQAEVFEAFRDMGASEDKALKAAAVLGKSGDEIAALRTDVNKEITGLRNDMNKEITGLRNDMNKEITGLRNDMNKQITDLRTDTNAGFAKVAVQIAKVEGEQVLARWMLGIMLAMLTTVLFRVFTH